MEIAPPTAHIHGPGELLAAVPYLLGFHPQQSLVLVGLADRHLVVTARLDLDDVMIRARLLHDTLEAMERGGTREVVAAVYTDRLDDDSRDQGASEPDGLAEVLADEAGEAGLELLDCMVVAEGRWRSVSCRNRACCPAEGRPLPAEPTVFQAEAVYAGTTVADSRASLAEQLAPFPDRHRLLPLISEAEVEATDAVLRHGEHAYTGSAVRALFAAARAATGSTPVFPDEGDAARCAVALTRVGVRDAVWLAVDDCRVDGRELWLDLARRLPGSYAAAPLFLYAWHAWRQGNGALAGIAAARVLDSDPDYSAAQLLLAALDKGINPSAVSRLSQPS